MRTRSPACVCLGELFTPHLIDFFRDKSKGIAFVQTKLKREALDAPGSGGIAVFPSYDELLACPDVDAVYIPLPNDIHFDWARKALVAGVSPRFV